LKLAIFVAMLGLVACTLAAPAARGQEREPGPPPPVKPEVGVAPGRVWRSLTTGKEYRVRVRNERFTAEWVNIPLQERQRGAYIRTECRRTGAKWIGTSQSFLPCESIEDGKPVTNWCRLTTKFEIHQMTEGRIAGRAEAARRFDCRTCRMIEPVWANFEWALRPESPPAGEKRESGK
jgi:hypothetical protein